MSLSYARRLKPFRSMGRKGMSLLPIDVQAFRRPPRCGLSAELFRRWPSGARMLLKSASIWLASVRVAKLGLIARILACGGFARERKSMFDRCGRLLASRASFESFGVCLAWRTSSNEDYKSLLRNSFWGSPGWQRSPTSVFGLALA